MDFSRPERGGYRLASSWNDLDGQGYVGGPESDCSLVSGAGSDPGPFKQVDVGPIILKHFDMGRNDRLLKWLVSGESFMVWTK